MTYRYSVEVLNGTKTTEQIENFILNRTSNRLLKKELVSMSEYLAPREAHGQDMEIKRTFVFRQPEEDEYTEEESNEVFGLGTPGPRARDL